MCVEHMKHTHRRDGMFLCNLRCLLIKLSNTGGKHTERRALCGRLGNQTLLRGECDFHTHVTLWLSVCVCVVNETLKVIVRKTQISSPQILCQ